MPTEVLRSDTFELWRQKTNTISSDLGTRGDLSVNITANGSLVTAINELQSDIGVVGSLSTFTATDLVSALNELKTGNTVTISGTKTFSSNLNLSTGLAFTINGTSVLNATTLGSGVVNSSLTSVGIIGSGTWQGAVIASNYGGTGVNNQGRTITLNTGNLTLIAQAAGSTVTVPASGTLATLAGSETLTTKTINLANNTLTGTLAQFNTALSDDDFAGLATAQTLTNKTIALGSNTITGTLAQFNTALTDDDFVAIGASQTLTNKSLTDANTFIIDDAAPTKRARFEASGITAGQTRVLTIQDKDGTVATTADTTFIGTTSITLSRGSGNLALAGISSVAFPGSTSGTVTLQPVAIAGTTTLTMPATTGTIITSGDTGTVTNAMLAGSIANGKLSNSSVTYNGVTVALGASGTITASTTNALTLGDGLTGGSFNGSAAVTTTVDSTIARRADTHFIGTTSVALNRTSANLALTGISSVTLPGATSGTIVLTPVAAAGTTTITLPATTGTLVTTGDSGTVSNTMLANSSVTVNPGTGMSGGGNVVLGGTITLTNSDRGSSQNIFKNIAVSGQTTIATNSNTDTLNVAIATVDALAGLTITTNATTKTLTIGHADTSSQASSSNSGGTVIQSITLDTYGHVTGLATVNAGGLYQPLDGDLTAIGAIADGSTGYLKKDGANTWSLDTTVVTTAGSQSLTNKTYSGSSLTVTTAQAQGSPITVSRVTNTTYASNLQDRFFVDSNGNVTIKGDLTVAGNTSISSSTLSPLWGNVTNKPTPTYTVELTGGPVTGSATSTASEVGSSVTISLTNVAITDGAVTTTKIGDAQVTNAKLASGIDIAKLSAYTFAVSGSSGLSAGGTANLGGTVSLTNTDRGSSQNIFKNIAVGGQSTVVADNNDDTLTLATDGSLVITTNATSDTITLVHADTSSVGNLSSDNSNGVVLQDIAFTYDTYGHVLTSAVATTDLDSRYLRLSNATQQTIGTGDVLFSGNVSVSGNLTINGTTTTVNSTTATVKDPIITLGGADAGAAAVTDDNKDRGIEFRWHNGTAAKTGFFGYDDSTGYFTFIPDATNTSEVFSGTQGDIQAANFRGALIGNATTASTWQTARTFTIGNTGKSVNGSADATWTLAEIGAIGPNGNTTGQAGSVANALTIGAGLSGTLSTYNGSAAVTISHSDTSSAADLTASSRRYVTGLSFDTYGHVTGYTTGTETVVDTDTNTTYSIKATAPGTGGGAFLDLDAGGSGSGTDSVRFIGSGSVTVSRTDADTITITGATYVTAVGATSPVASTGGAAPVISLNAAYGDTLNPYGTKTANVVLAGPATGAAAAPTFRALVAADIPTLNQNTTGSAGSLVNALTIGTGLGGVSYNGSSAVTITNTDKGSDQNIFKNVALSGTGTNSITCVADANNDTLTLSASSTSGISISADATTDTITFTNTGVTGITANLVPSGGSFGGAGTINFTGTANQVHLNSSGSTLTFSAPQNIHTGATPTFAGMTLSGLTGYLKANGGSALTASSTIPSADISNTSFVDLTTSQAASGVKTFNNAVLCKESLEIHNFNLVNGLWFMKSDSTYPYRVILTGNNISHLIGGTSVYTLLFQNNNGSLSLKANGTVEASSTVQATGFKTASGTSAQFLKADGSVDSTTYLTSAVTSLTGTTNQVTVSASTGSVTLSLPQNISTTSSPTFFGATLTGLAGYVKASASGALGTLTASTTVPWSDVSGAPSFLTTAVTSLTGTTNQVTVSASTGSVTLSLPQSISTVSSLQFGSLGIGTPASGATGEIRATDNITAYYTSDERLKTNVRPIENALDKVSQIDGVIYDWNDTYKKDHGDVDGYFVRPDNSGVIAQQVEKVFPNVVANRADGFKAVRYELLVPLLIEAIKDLKAEIEALKAQK
jgi:hypothetical protein